MTEHEKYTPAVGDRVRVTYTCEGEVTSVGYETFLMKGVDSENLPFERCYVHDPKPEHLSFEKLQDPEPTWVNGDVIAVPEQGETRPSVEFHRIGTRWLTKSGAGIAIGPHLSTWWQAGKVEIRYKADGQNAA